MTGQKDTSEQVKALDPLERLRFPPIPRGMLESLEDELTTLVHNYLPPVWGEAITDLVTLASINPDDSAP